MPPNFSPLILISRHLIVPFYSGKWQDHDNYQFLSRIHLYHHIELHLPKNRLYKHTQMILQYLYSQHSHHNHYHHHSDIHWIPHKWHRRRNIRLYRCIRNNLFYFYKWQECRDSYQFRRRIRWYHHIELHLQWNHCYMHIHNLSLINSEKMWKNGSFLL